MKTILKNFVLCTSILLVQKTTATAQHIGNQIYSTPNSTEVFFSYSWNEFSKSWNQSLKEEIIFDSLGRNVRKLRYNFLSVLQTDENYLYNQSGQLYSTIHRDYIPDVDSFLNTNKFEKQFDTLGRIIQSLGSVWNVDSAKWINVNRINSIYDANSNVIEYTQERRDSNGWMLYSGYQNNYIYQGNKLSEILNFRYNLSQQKFDSSYSIYYTYPNDSTYEMRKINYTFSWIPEGKKDYKRIYDMDSNFNLKRETQYIGNALNEWEGDYMRDEIEIQNYYDSSSMRNSKRESWIEKKWNTSLQRFETEYKYVKDSFIVSNENSRVIYQLVNSNWDTLTHNLWQYDHYDNLIEYGSYSYSTGQKVLTSGNQYNYTYTNGKKYYDLIYKYDGPNNTWINSRRDIYALLSNVNYNKSVPALFKIFPNPSNGEFEIEFKTKLKDSESIQLFDLQGRLIHNLMLDFNTNRKVVRGIEKGVYLLQYKNYIEKIIVQ